MNSRKASEYSVQSKILWPPKRRFVIPYNFLDRWKRRLHRFRSEKFQLLPVPNSQTDVAFRNDRNFHRILRKDKAIRHFVKLRLNSFWWRFRDEEWSSFNFYNCLIRWCDKFRQKN